MLILALDTTTSGGSCALMRDDRVVREDASDSSRSHAARLPGELVSLLEREAVTLAQIDGLAVGVGPGSFTGLRVGIATMQGLAVALNRPLFGVSALDALATLAAGGSGLITRPDPPHESEPIARPDPPHASGSARGFTDGLIATWIDAWRGEVYASGYEHGVEVEPPTVAAPEQLLRRLAGRSTLFTGDGAEVHREAIRAALGDHARFTQPVMPLLAGAMAGLAAKEFRAGRRPLPHAIRPLYVRRSDAELARDQV